MKKSELVTLGIATAAFVLSGLSFYYQFIEKSQELLASVLEWRVAGNTFTTTVAVINEGNRPTLLHSISPCLVGDNSRTAVDSKQVTVEHRNAALRSKLLPAVIDPKEIKIVPMDVQLSGYEDLSATQLGLLFFSMDSKGQTFETLHCLGQPSGEAGQIGIDLLESENRTGPITAGVPDSNARRHAISFCDAKKC